jgi:phosphoserine phosphatase
MTGLFHPVMGSIALATPGPPSSVFDRIIGLADLVRQADDSVVPVAFWDLDGTLLEGDCVDGYRRRDGAGYAGMVERAIDGGLCPAFAASGGMRAYLAEYRRRRRRDGRAAAYTFQSLIFAGAAMGPLKELARRVFSEELAPWFFADALDGWKRLEGAGVRCWVVSASPDFFVRGAASVLGVPEDRCVGMRLRRAPDDSSLLPELDGPALFGQGKAHCVRRLLDDMAAAQPGRRFLPVAAFGNDPESDGPMLEEVRQRSAPSGASVGALINVPRPAPAPGITHLRFSRRPSSVQ